MQKYLSHRIKLGLTIALSLVTLFSCGTKKKKHQVIRKPIAHVEFPAKEEWQVPHSDSLRGEMRAVWLTLAYGLDWPKAKADNYRGIRRQKAELNRLLDQLKRDNYNTVFFQARLSGSACYLGSKEPMARIFTSSGRKPKYDPLAYAVEACHKRGLQIHAWIVTYPISISRRSRHIVKQKHPSWIIRHKRSHNLNPGEPRVRTYIANIAQDIAKRYDVDGLHFDYFRYPEGAKTFRDTKTYKKYAPKGMSREAWRRDNLCKQLKEINQKVRLYKPNIQISVAPLGKLKQIPTLGRKHGWTAYETVHQDVERWAREGLVDFVAPMMYYKDDLYEPFLIDWQKKVGKYIPVVAGLAPYRMNDEGWSTKTIAEQIEIARRHKAGGVSFFRAEHIDSRNEMMKRKVKEAFRKPALFPQLHGVKHTPKRPEHLQTRVLEDNSILLTWDYPSSQTKDIHFRIWATIHHDDGTKQSFMIADKVQSNECKFKLKKGYKGNCLELGVEAVNKVWRASKPCLRSLEFNLNEFRARTVKKEYDKAKH